MNRLLNKAPRTVSLGGVDYEINTDWRDCLFTIEQLQSPDYEPEEKIGILINNMYLDDPPDLREAVEKALWFLRCGKDFGERNLPKLCDFDQDSNYIYEAFLKANIDLDAIEDMHWWTFMARFAELPESNFSRIIYLRSQQSRGKLTKEERRECERIGWDVVNIKPPETLEDKIQNQVFKDYFQDDQ